MRRICALIAVVFLLGSEVVMAGGSFEQVMVSTFRLTSATDYELVVIPATNSSDGYDGYMRGCKTFTVLGTYTNRPAGGRWWHFWNTFGDSVTREAHVLALSKIEAARTAKLPLNLGWMGPGFAPIDSATRCVVRSRALQTRHEDDVDAVVSYHDAV